MKTFFDSSAFAKRYVEEPGSQAVDELCLEAADLALSVLAVPEILSALNRRVGERNLTKRDYTKAKQRLLEDVRDAAIVNLTPFVVADSIALLEKSPLRAMDALHIACAIQWKADIFVSSDKKQITAAKKSGLSIKYV